MASRVFDGKAIAAKVRSEVAQGAQAFRTRHGRPPGLAVVRVGDDAASKIYVDSKEKVAREIGFHSVQHHLPEATTEAVLIQLVERLNADATVDGILVQLPLPRHMDSARITQTIDPRKDVDGLHPENGGRLFSGNPRLVPCTPAGVMRMLHEADCKPAGKNCLVVGRSAIVGRPMAMLLLAANGTVTIAHSKSDLPHEVARADILVAAVGVPELIKGAWIKPGAVVIDVGVNRMPDGKLKGDVEFAAASERASWISPVPGGVGPMTIAMLMSNTLQAARAAAEGTA